MNISRGSCLTSPSTTLHLNSIKNKTTGKARQIIDIHSHLTTWDEIKELLVNQFSSFKVIHKLLGELRDLRYQTPSLDFYNRIQEKLCTLNNKCRQEGNFVYTPRNIITALETFKNKLPESMSTILYARDPHSLDQALNILSASGHLYTGTGHNR